jgi:hypothetical protein
MLKMELPQESLEEAIRQYVSENLGLNLPVTEINFTAQRSNGNKILTELMVGSAKPGTTPLKAVAKEATTAAVEEPETTEEVEAENVSEADTPAVAEKPEDPEEAPIPAGKSLFG